MYASRGRRGVRKPDLPATPGQKRSPYIVDKSLTPRIKQYLSQFRKGYTPDIDELTSHLQTRYGEYNRKKRNSFRLSVLKVYQNICHEQSEETMLQNLEDKFLTKRRKSPGFMPMEEDILSTDAVGHGVNFSREQSSASDSELSLNDEPLMEAKDTNLMNQSMQKMYKVSSSQHASEAEDESKPIFVIPLGDKIKDLSQTPLSSHNEPAIGSSNPALPPSTAEVTHQRILDQQDNVNERRNTETLEKKPSKSVKKKRRREGSSKEGTEKPLESFASTQSSVKFADIGGCSNTLEQVGKLLVHMCHPEVFTTLGVTPTTGFLLHGPPGCGKTLLAHAIAGLLRSKPSSRWQSLYFFQGQGLHCIAHIHFSYVSLLF